MATTKISELPAASTLTGAETLPIVQGGVTKKVTTDRFARLTDAQRAAGALGVPAVLPNGGLVLPDGVVNNPDSPIRLNPRRIAVNFTVPTGYNAASTGPITVADGVAVTVATGAAWSVH